jgi:hypothetical protein
MHFSYVLLVYGTCCRAVSCAAHNQEHMCAVALCSTSSEQSKKLLVKAVIFLSVLLCQLIAVLSSVLCCFEALQSD